jgi:hypothetical protein
MPVEQRHRNLSAAVPLTLALRVVRKAVFGQEASMLQTTRNFRTQVVSLEATSTHAQLDRRSGGMSSRKMHSITAANSEHRCCKSNPCSNAPASTCKDGDLVPAFLGRPDQFNAYAPSSIPSPSSTPKSGSSSGAVIGGAVGGGVGAAIIIGILIFLCCRRRKHNQQPDQAEAGATASTPMMKQGFEESFPAQHDGQSRESL